MDEQRLRQFYAAFNARDINSALDSVTEDVDWPNGWEGGRVQGREAVRSYWSRQWSEVDSRVDPVTIRTRADGRIEVDAHQVAHSPSGAVLWDGRVRHVYELRDNLVARMDIEEPPESSPDI